MAEDDVRPVSEEEAAPPRGWVCEAYGDKLPEACFFDLAAPCGSRAECEARLPGERERIFGRIQEMAAGGDLAAREMAAEIKGAEELLGGPGQVEEAEARAPGRALDSAEVAVILRQPPGLTALWTAMGTSFRMAEREGLPVVECYASGDGVVTAWFVLDAEGRFTGVQVVPENLRAAGGPAAMRPGEDEHNRRIMQGVGDLYFLEEAAAGALAVMLGPHSAFTAVSALQVAWRHPDMTEAVRARVRAIGEQIQDALAVALDEVHASPAARSAAAHLALGWDEDPG